MDPAGFVHDLPPFRDLSAARLERLTARLEILYRPGGSVVLERGGAPSDHLWIVRTGLVELRSGGDSVLDVEPGEWFGFPSLLQARAPAFDAVVVEDALLYRLPGDAVRPLLDDPRVAAHVTGGLADRLRAVERDSPDLPTTQADLPVGRLVRRPPAVVPATTTVQEAADRMRREHISSVVVDQRPWTVVTERDLRDVVARGQPSHTPVGQVAAPAACAARGATVADVLDVLLDQATHHVVLTEDGGPMSALHGVVTTGDLLRQHADSPVHVIRAVRRAASVDELAATRQRAVGLARSLVGAGLDALVVLRTLSALSDAATVAALRLAADEVEVPDVPWAWLAAGSQGRREQGLVTDQDHALVHDVHEPAVLDRLAAMAERVVDLLEVAGLPRCPGDAMATRWSGDVDAWVRRVQGWATRPDPQALLDVAILFDHRVVVGDLAIDRVEAAFEAAGQDDVFTARLAAAADTHRPPRWLRRPSSVDVKADGLLPIVDLARVLALRVGTNLPGTIDRLALATDAGLLSEDGREILTEAFRFLQGLRLHHHLAAIAAGRELDNRIELASLSPLDRSHLPEVRAEVRRLHRQVLDACGARDVPG